MSIKYDVEGFQGVRRGFSASFCPLTAGKGLLTVSESEFYQNMLTTTRRKVTVLVLN